MSTTGDVVDEGYQDSIDAHPAALNVVTAMRRFAPVMHGQRWKLAVSVLLFFIEVGTSVVTVAVFADIVDNVLVAGDLSALWWPLGIWAAVSLVGAAASYGGTVISGLVAERTLLRLRDRLYAHTQQLAPHTRRQFETGDLIARHSGDVDEIEHLVSSGVVAGTLAIGSAIIYAVAAFVTRWDLALLAFVLAPLLWVVSRWFGRVVKTAARRERKANGRISSRIQEGITHAISIQADNQGERDRRKVLRESRIWRNARVSELKANAAFSETVTVVEMLCMMAVLAVGAWQISRGVASVGTLIALTGYLGYMYPHIQTLGGLVVSVTSATASAERVAEVLDAPIGITDTAEPELSEADALAGSDADAADVHPDADVDERSAGPVASAVSVHVDRVSFAYPDSDRLVLDDVDLTIESGDFVALLGASGSGKSTLMYLMLRFYDPVAGAIRFNDTDIRSMSLRQLRAHMAVLPQRVALFNASIADNIRYGRPDATDEQVLAAATAADAAGFVGELPDGLDTQLRDGGANLSGGQQQRIGLARAFLRDTPLLILDEPTTGLDDATTQRVMAPLERLARSRTTVLITHDDKVAAVADYTLTVRDGTIRRR
ncbi:ABC transporter ATP-binding protein [Gordonia sp. SL306]|uniref:ABC transporter ATP-binding protein n=1 Tax=Gordonia sp. SL306 TaxID=2995145 RepID=UPI00226FFCCF|nr:ABC transporter ATP-binding protein [Gordonia sp. SL306]WAC54477.1 ABC transporter ATP-binding protein [Gordonia sp. SL306]